MRELLTWAVYFNEAIRAAMRPRSPAHPGQETDWVNTYPLCPCVAKRARRGAAEAARRALLWLAVAGVTTGLLPAHAFTPERLDFAVRVKDEVSSHRVLGVFVLPAEKLEIEILARSEAADDYQLHTPDGVLRAPGAPGWSWRAPAKKGLHPLTIVHVPSGETMILNVFVMVPYAELEQEGLVGYSIGPYPQTPLQGSPLYLPPAGFVEVTPDNRTVALSPHFTLGQFVCKQPGGYPKYLVVRERLVLKLELLLEAINARGYDAETFHVMSGYRTPSYNKAIGNVRYSRHIYGDAADIFIDEQPKDGRMDDLNGDGVVDFKDADILRDTVEQMCTRPSYVRFVGGLGSYGVKPHRGPFVHLDTRGFRARWNR